MSRFVVAISCACVVLFVGCEEPGSPTPQVSGSSEEVVQRSLWHGRDATQVVVVDGALEAELTKASEKARATVGRAMIQWQQAEKDTRHRWAVKWAAPTVESGVEHVWVIPQHWSRFRIEGYLVNPPQTPLQCGRSEGELVSFPVEELSDWVRLHTDDFGGPRDGGYTLDVLEERYGKPEDR